MKLCRICKIEKELNEFHKNGKWYRNTCKRCHNEKYQPATGKINTGRFQKGHIPINGFKKGHITWNKGKKHSDETRKKISEKVLGRTQPKEEIDKRRKSLIKARFKDRTGLSRRSVRYREWTRSVRERDGMCVECKNKENLHSHHIIPWNENIELRFDMDNGITLCASCHIKKEKYGKK